MAARNPTPAARAAREELGSAALSEQSLPSMLQTAVDVVKRVMPKGTEASVSVLIADKPTTFVYTGQLALDLDESQYGHGYGPCLHAASTGEVVEVTDARTEARWTGYMRRAVELDALSSLSLPLVDVEQMAAGLNVYGRPAEAFDEDSRRTATELARLTGVTVANMHAFKSAREMADNLRKALVSRAIIDQAKGVLIERHRLTADQAFQLLSKASMTTNRKLRDVAEHLVVTGELLGPSMPS
jgi:GAF domain-containing protein